MRKFLIKESLALPAQEGNQAQWSRLFSPYDAKPASMGRGASLGGEDFYKSTTMLHSQSSGGSPTVLVLFGHC